jgi:hypothetical protein
MSLPSRLCQPMVRLGRTMPRAATGGPDVSMRQKLVWNGIFPVCRRRCEVEPSPAPAAAGAPVAEEPLAVAVQGV